MRYDIVVSRERIFELSSLCRGDALLQKRRNDKTRPPE